MKTTKVIDLGNRVIFADNIKSIYQDRNNWNNDDFHIETKDNNNYRVAKEKYYEVKEYLLSLNDDTKDDTYEHLLNTLSGRCKKLIDYIDDLKDSKIISIKIAKNIKDIIQSGF